MCDDSVDIGNVLYKLYDDNVDDDDVWWTDGCMSVAGECLRAESACRLPAESSRSSYRLTLLPYHREFLTYRHYSKFVVRSADACLLSCSYT